MNEGLSSTEARARLKTFGPNELPGGKRRNFGRIALDVLREPLLLLLIAASLIYLVLGDMHEAVLLMGLACMNVTLIVYQEQKTERILETLKDLTSPRALVIRDGIHVRVPGREVVPGDLLVLAEGDRVAADASLIEVSNLSVDESLATGESVPVQKEPDRDGADGHGQVLAATLVVRGRGIGRVDKTGAQSEIGRIGKTVAGIEFEKTRLHRMTVELTRSMAVFGGAVSVLVILFQGLRTEDWLAGGLAGIAIAMSMLPEEIPVVLTIFLTLGAWRLSRHNVLTRRAAAIETLGAATVLCTDKTGTLTLNRMSITELWADGRSAKVAEDSPVVREEMRAVVETGALASDAVPVDPMEQTFRNLAARTGGRADRTLVREYGLGGDFLAVTKVWRSEAQDAFYVATKGAPETIAALCRVDEVTRTALLREAENMAVRGMRVLGVADADHAGALPDDPREFHFRLRGLAGLADPLRPAVPEAVAECRRAGIRVVMITGDHPATARAIAVQAGIESGGIITGADLMAMDAAILADRIRDVNIFARVRPEQKLRLVAALKATGEVVAMTGDGVNDAPALKAANIGIAMGKRGTDVAREAAALVLLDDAFESIVTAIRHGRRIFGNLRKALSYILAVHIPIAGVALIPLTAGWPIVFTPIHIVFLELIIDPVCSLAFESEPEGHNLMREPPHAPAAPLFGRREIAFGILQGSIALAAILAVFGYSLGTGANADTARTVAFITLVATNILLVLTNRSWTQSLVGSLLRPNIALWLVIASTVLFLTAALNVAYLREAFQFAALPPSELLHIAVASAVAALGIEAMKFARGWLDRLYAR